MDVGGRSPRSIIFALRAPVATMTGSVWALYGPMAIPVGGRGASCSALLATSLSWNLAVRPFMASLCRLRYWYGRWVRWPKAWAFARSPVCSRGTPIRCWPGGPRWRTTPHPEREHRGGPPHQEEAPGHVCHEVQSELRPVAG